jgi:hypothetical protein
MRDPGDPPAREVHALLAAAMADPDLLNLWRREPTRLAESGAGAAELDVENIWRFSGLVTKVRHNDLRPSLPATFRIMDSAGLSIELFASYAPTAAKLRKDGRNSKTAKVAALIEFLDGWLDRTNPLQAVIWDVIRHESAIFHLRGLAATQLTRARDTEQREVSAEAVPVRSAGAVQLEMSCNPVDAVRIVRAGGDLASVPREHCLFAYCLAEDGVQTRVMAIDEITSFLMNAADGNRTVSRIAELFQTSGVHLAAEDLTGPIGDLVASGLLEIVHNNGG